MRIIAQAFQEMVQNENITEAPKICGDEALGFNSGKTIFRYVDWMICFNSSVELQ